MLGEEDKDSPSGTSNRRPYSRSVSWTDRSPTKSNSKPQFNSKARACLPPLQPLAVSRPRAQEWPRAGSDDLGVWPNPPTPRVAVETVKLFGNSDSGKPPREFEFKKDKLAFFDKECSRVADHIYLGSDAVAKNREILKQNGITHVLNCVGFVCPEYFKKDLVYKTLWLQDSPSEDITSILYDVFDYFEDVREQGGRVLVHCCQGVSRSTSLVIAYLMWREGRSFEDAFQHVKAARGVTNPNMGFACQLLQCQKRVHVVPTSPNSMLRIYRMAPHSPYDPLHLVPKMLSQPSADGLDSRGAFIIHVPSAIYTWIGKNCMLVMSENARAAAFQVIRYERAQGPVLTVREGEEPPEFWVALGNGERLAESIATHANAGHRKVGEYDLDFEIFCKALAGGVVPPFALSGSGSETCLPARENGWSRLRRKFASGIMKEFITISKLNCDSITQSSHNTDVVMDTHREDESPLSPPTDPTLPSSPRCDSPDSSSSFATSSPNWIKNTCKEVDNSVPQTDPFLSPTPLCGSVESFSRFLVKNPNFSSRSPSLSPSTSDYSNSFTFSPSSSNWSDLSYLSAQPSPSGLESKEPFPTSKGDSLAENALLLSKEHPASPEESFSANHASRNSFGRGNSPSIAERRGSNPPPRMMLPSVDDLQEAPENLVRSWSFSLADIEDDVMREIECNRFEQEGFYEINRDELMEDADLFTARDEFQTEMRHDDGYDNPQTSDINSLVLYQWPTMDKVEMHCFDILDSRSIYVMFVPDVSVGTNKSDVLYVWVGRDVSCEKGEIPSIGGDGKCLDGHIQWETIGHDVLIRKGLATNSLVQVTI